MSFLKKRYEMLGRVYENAGPGLMRRVDSETENLRSGLSRLIDDIRNDPNFPKNAEEILYKFSEKGGCRELVIVKDLNEAYALTKKGLKHLWELRLEGDMLKKLTIKTVSPRKLAFNKTDPSLFVQVCNNLQRIMDKYKIEVDEKKYL